jgi:hypothetical protein
MILPLFSAIALLCQSRDSLGDCIALAEKGNQLLPSWEI